jgi:peptidoglycan hydrolase FlgJ
MSGINKLGGPMAPPTAENKAQAMDKKLHDVANMYEQHFIREMMKQMRSTVSEGGFIKANNAEKIFQEQLDDQYADQWQKSGGIGFSKIIYDQLIEKYGPQFGLKARETKPQGPIDMGGKSQYTGSVTPAASAAPKSMEEAGQQALKSNSPITFKFQTPQNEKQALTSPWAGVLLDKKFLESDQVQYRIKHDNGLESLILTRGTGLGPEQKLSPGDTIEAGQQLGWASAASPLFWTVKPNVSE